MVDIKRKRRREDVPRDGRAERAGQRPRQSPPPVRQDEIEQCEDDHEEDRGIEMQLLHRELQQPRGKAAARAEQAEQRFSVDVEQERDDEGQQHPERAEDAEQAQAQIAARLGDAVDSVQPQQEAVHPLRAGPDDGDGADGDERDGLHIVESVEQVFKQGHERRRGHLREKAEHVRLLQAGALQDREQDAHERKQAQQQEERGIARIERDAQRGDALRPFFDPAVKTHAKPSFLPTA